MPRLGILPQSLGGQRSLHIQLPLNIEAGARLYILGHLHALNMLKCICTA